MHTACPLPAPPTRSRRRLPLPILFLLHSCAGVTHWQSPNFFAYFAANSSFPGILAEMLMT
jgi:hypothetical protein